VTTIQILILTPLTYLGGVFNSIASLPDWTQELSLVNPMYYMVNVFRYGFLGISDMPVSVAFSVISAFGAVLLVAAVILMARGSGIRE
jgi:ABC-2 type transport system permease protein